jgi:hypothetical protein
MLKENYIKRLKELAGIISENNIEEKNELNDLIYSNEVFLSENEKFRKYFKGIQINDYKNKTFPENNSEKTREELLKIKALKADEEFIREHDNIYYVFKKYFEENNLDFPKLLVKDLIEASRYFLMKLKYHYKRPRPYQIAKKMDINLNSIRLSSAKSPSFPSGHASQSNLIAYVLSDMFPKHEDKLMKIADNISKSRMMAKVHFPSDIEYGEKIAKDLFKQYKKNNK